MHHAVAWQEADKKCARAEQGKWNVTDLPEVDEPLHAGAGHPVAAGVEATSVNLTLVAPTKCKVANRRKII